MLGVSRSILFDCYFALQLCGGIAQEWCVLAQFLQNEYAIAPPRIHEAKMCRRTEVKVRSSGLYRIMPVHNQPPCVADSEVMDIRKSKYMLTSLLIRFLLVWNSFRTDSADLQYSVQKISTKIEPACHADLFLCSLQGS